MPIVRDRRLQGSAVEEVAPRGDAFDLLRIMGGLIVWGWKELVDSYFLEEDVWGSADVYVVDIIYNLNSIIFTIYSVE